MSFAWPVGFFFALLALPILLLYVLKVRLRRLPVSTNLFWKQVYDEKPPRSIWQKFRHWLSLLAQLLILGLLVWAIVDPYLPWQILQARRIVLVVDNSASMQATDVSPSRLSIAKDEAQRLISSLRERDQVAVVLAGQTPEVIVGMTGHIPTLRRALDAIPPSENATHLPAAIQLGQQLVGDHPHGQVIVLTDGCLASDDMVTPAAATQEAHDAAAVSWKTVASDANNVGITQFQTRRSLTDSLGYEILVSVWNASDAPVRCRLEITLDEVPVDVIPLELAADEKRHRTLEKTSIEGGTLRAALTAIQDPSVEAEDSSTSTGDATGAERLNRLTVDDTAWAVLPARNRQKVLVISPGNLFLWKVFEANPLVDLEVRETFPDSWPADTVVVLHGQVPEQLPAGNVFVIDPDNNCDQWTIGEALEHPIITEQDEESPLMTHIRLDNVLVPKARKLQFNDPPSILAGTVSGDVIYAQPKRDNGRCLVLSVNLEQSDLAFRTAFPIMVTNALNWFARQSGQWQPALSTGALLAIDLSDTAVEPPASLQWIPPSGVAQTLDAHQAELTLGPFDQTGVWSLRQPAPASDAKNGTSVAGTAEARLVRGLAVNLADERETDLRPDADLVERTNDSQRGTGWLNRPIWFYLTLLACLVITTEWFLYQRRLLA